jgi:hypothetical protein
MTPEEIARHRETLAHVFWIGGPPDAGKSTAAGTAANELGASLYRQDGEEMNHLLRADSASHPQNAHLHALVRSLSEAPLIETLWLRDTPEAMARQARRVWEERIDFICDDLLKIPNDQPIVAEGPGLFPAVVVPLLSRPNQAVWLVPTEAFKRESHGRRRKSEWRSQTSDPETAMANHIARDLILANQYREELAQRRMPWIEIDGSEDADVVADRVVRWFRGDGRGRP